MLGRYIAGTLLVLGVAMMVAPDGPESKPSVPVSRTETSPVALATAEPEAMAAAVRNSSDTMAERPAPMQAPVSDPEPTSMQAGVHAALAQALALDATETAAEEPLSPADEPAPVADAPLPAEGETGADTALLAGLTLDMDASTAPFLRLPDQPEATAQTEASLAEGNARMMYVTGTKVNVRSGPSTQYRVVDTVAYGDSVELVAYEGDGWARIRIGNSDMVGFMSRNFLDNELSGG
ncbi:SH3 domain-containing protein [Aliiruegeria sabulilitoris]|uniref:SH3 domain-containing protein n=1 Tax=Aliiruegeria sabulilitoris TaxID=1510458 RepID=UPI00082C2BC1|nr:SH3 domain-containing protein [Aliiruegeria sabulilitoris]NDR56846.1 SH3 domain-containing protein [Pseudoruegeria sp. M32A2M]